MSKVQESQVHWSFTVGVGKPGMSETPVQRDAILKISEGPYENSTPPVTQPT